MLRHFSCRWESPERQGCSVEHRRGHPERERRLCPCRGPGPPTHVLRRQGSPGSPLTRALMMHLESPAQQPGITCSHLEAAEGARAVVLPREAVGRPSKASASGQQGSRRRGWEAALLLEKTLLPPRPGRTRLLARSASNGSLRLSCPERSLPGDHFPGSQFS